MSKSRICIQRLTGIVLSLLLATTAFAARHTIGSDAVTEVTVIDGSWGNSVLECTVGAFDSEELTIAGELYHAINLTGEPRLQVVGSPALPHLTVSIVIPDAAGTSLRIMETEYTDFPGLRPEPSKGIITRNIDPATVPYTFSDTYSDVAYPSDVAKLGTPYILRDFRGQVVHFQPFRWLPETNTLRVYSRILVAVETSGRAGVNVIDRPALPVAVDGEFLNIYRRHFVNFDDRDRYDPLEEQGSLLIITADAFHAEMLPLLEWKLQKGIPTEIVDLSAVGSTSTQVLSFVQDYYDTQGLTFLLLVGDAEDLPTPNAGGGSSDPSYSLLSGSDNYPDIFVGRFSGETPTQVATMVERTLEYERDASTATWYHKGVGVASNQGPGDDGEYDNEHVDFIRDDLLAYTYTEVDQIYDPSANAAMVATALNDGRSIINYCGHGSSTSWGSSGFDINDINALVNNNMLPFIQSVACVNGQFAGQTCFSEAWMRATNGDQPTGAIGIYASSINQSWNSPMCGQDEMVDLLVQDEKRTYGGICFNGSMQMMDEYGADGTNMFLTWHIFGDPSLQLRTDSPAPLSVLHAGAMLSVMPTYDVTVTGLEGALCTLYGNGVLYGSAQTGVGGNATITLAETPEIGAVLTLTVTAYNYAVYQGEVTVLPPEGPYVIFDECFVMDINAQLNPGESPFLSLVVYNLGVDIAEGVTVTLQMEDEYVTLLDAEEYYGDIEPSSSATVEAGFQVAVTGEAPDGHIAAFTLVAATAGESWESSFTLAVHAPQLVLTGILIVDGGDGILDPGESVELEITLTNNGSGEAAGIVGLLTSTDEYITIDIGESELPEVAPGGEGLLILGITVDAAAPIGHAAAMQLQLTGEFYNHDENFYLGIGLIEDGFESGDFTVAPWEMAGASPWMIDDVEPFGGAFCARSGMTANNETSELLIQVILSVDDVLLFHVHTSSQNNSDYLVFRVDDEPAGTWSGETSWQQVSYNLTAGSHLLSWIFERDGSGGSGQNCAWIDNVIFPPTGFPPDISPPVIFHDPLADTENTGPWMVTASLHDPAGLTAYVEYRFNGAAWHSVPLADTAGDCSAAIPGPVAIGTLVDYRIVATDESENNNSITSEIWSFAVLEPQGMAYCQDFEEGFNDWTIVEWGPGNTWVLYTYGGHGNTAYICYGLPGVEEHAGLISPIFDCSNQAALELSFWHCLSMGFPDSWTLATIWGSVDGGDTWPVMLAQWDSDEYGEVEIIADELVDITSWAAGQSQVRIMFEYHADYDWYWFVDDICLNGVLIEAPDGITDLQITYTPGNDSLQLYWSPPENADSYNVYSATGPVGPWTLAATVTQPAYTVTHSDGSGFYQVTWVNNRFTGNAPTFIDPLLGMRPAEPRSK